MAELLSKSLVILNVSDGQPGKPGDAGAPGTSYYVHIKYSQNEDGTDFSDTPGPYMGVYTGTEKTPPTNKESYQWTKIEGADGKSTYVDIRYSNDGTTFTDNKGTVPGDYLGTYVTTDEEINQPTYEPEFSNYTWKLITGDPTKSYYYKLNYSSKVINKFFSSKTQIVDGQYVGAYSYSPSTFTVTLQKVTPATTTPVTDLKIVAYYTYYNDANNLVADPFTEESKDGILSLDLSSSVLENKNLQSISFIVKNDEAQLMTDIVDITYGLTDDMAKFSLNATNIVQSILNTTLTFDTDGLTIKNGGFTIKNDTGEKVFYADNLGNLFFSGTINTSSGSLGGWIIEPSVIRDNNNKVGLYSGDDAKYEINNALVRFWAGATFSEDTTSYNFAVTEDGTLYASDIILSNKLISNGAAINNKLSIGNKDNGIILYGNEEDSFISSAQYSSGAAGYGWKINQDGSAEFSNIIARGKIQSSVFEYNKVSSVGGSLYIAPTIYIENHSEIITKDEENNKYILKWVSPYTNAQDICGHSWTTEDFVKLNGEILVNGIKVTLAGIDAEIAELTTNSTVSFTFTIDIGLVSDDITNGVLQPGGTIILYGTGGKKQGLYLTAADSGSPYMDVYDSDKNAVIMPAVRLGNLSGISDANFPGGKLQGYGLYSSNAYLRGQLMLPGAGITNQNNVTYGDGDTNSPIRIWAGSTGDDITQANFIVTANGYLYAKQGVFEGTVKATNSEFSGTIRTAGVVINENGTGANPLPAENHFFVAYNQSPTTFNDYVLDIGEHGLSIWEGALRAYSDFASGENNYPTPYQDDIYGYNPAHPETMPLPYFTLVDSGTETQLDARIVAHKAHFANIVKNDSSYYVNSAVVANGIWFGENTYSEISKATENTSYYNVLNQKKFGIGFSNNILSVNGENVSINTNHGYFNYTQDEIKQTLSNGFHIKGPLSINSDGTDNVVIIGTHTIKERVIDNKSIGLDFIIK